MVFKLSNIASQLKSHYDAFIVSASYEKRCLSITNNIINEIKFNFKFVGIVTIDKEIIGDKYKTFTETYGFESIEVDSKNQINTAANIIYAINKVFKSNSNASFLIDISTFRRQTLLILLRLIRNILTKNNYVQFLYTPAEEYSVGLPENEKWLTKGITDVNSVFGYSGIIRPSRPYHLILLMGYEVERASTLISVYEPSRITIGYAKKIDSIDDKHYELNEKRFDELLDEFPRAESFEFSCIDLQACKADIAVRVKKYKDHNIIISPMHNKISTVASAISAFENEEIQLAIAIPAIYNTENYSTPSDNCYILNIPELIKLK